MTPGYTEFEFDLPGALLARLVEVFDTLAPIVLETSVAAAIPEAQGVYQLLIHDGATMRPVYVGKTDAKAGLSRRLRKHARKIQHRKGLDPTKVYFKAVRVFVFTAVDLEAQLIKHLGGTDWNGSGFGSSDPGKERDTTKYKARHFDTLFPIEVERPLSFKIPLLASAATILKSLKSGLPYLIRYQGKGGSSGPHKDLEDTKVAISPSPRLSPKDVIQQIVSRLPPGWHATKLPSHVIIYKDDPRDFPSGLTLQKS